jgi:hypothetical protein
MDDLMNKLSEVLNDPQSMRQISQLASALSETANESAAENQSSEQKSPDISSMLSALMNQPSSPAANSAPTPPAAESNQPDLGKLMQIGGIISKSAANDKNVALLMALRPLLKEENQVKIDKLVKIFRLMAAYPLIRDSGLLGGDLFG